MDVRVSTVGSSAASLTRYSTPPRIHCFLSAQLTSPSNLTVPLLKKIMVALDGSPLAEMALPHAAELAAKMGLGSFSRRVFGVPTPTFAEEYGPYVEELWEQVETETHALSR